MGMVPDNHGGPPFARRRDMKLLNPLVLLNGTCLPDVYVRKLEGVLPRKVYRAVDVVRDA